MDFIEAQMRNALVAPKLVHLTRNVEEYVGSRGGSDDEAKEGQHSSHRESE